MDYTTRDLVSVDLGGVRIAHDERGPYATATVTLTLSGPSDATDGPSISVALGLDADPRTSLQAFEDEALRLALAVLRRGAALTLDELRRCHLPTP